MRLVRALGKMMLYVAAALVTLVAALVLFLVLGGPALPAETDEVIAEVSRNDLSHVVSGETGYADSGGVRIRYESISPAGPPEGVVLLSFAMGGDGLFGPPRFLRAFVEAGYQVVRYDHRGTGMSDWIAQWNRKQPYSLIDMAEDAVAVLDALNVEGRIWSAFHSAA